MPAEVTKIQDYAIIGNGRSAALISKRGSLDWLCWPRFDSPSVFGAILDSKCGGYWSIHPARDSEVRRRYIENTNVLEMTFLGASGEIVLTDFSQLRLRTASGAPSGPSTSSLGRSSADRAK